MKLFSDGLCSLSLNPGLAAGEKLPWLKFAKALPCRVWPGLRGGGGAGA